MEKHKIEWRPIPTFGGRYEISNTGLARRSAPAKSTYVGRVRVPRVNRWGYLHFVATRDDKCVDIRIHRAVAIAFLGDPPFPGAQVNHKDGNKLNNRVENLEWCSRQENVSHSRRVGLCHDTKIVCQLTGNGSLVRKYESIHAAARALGLQVGNISACCNHKKRKLSVAKTAHGFAWRKNPDGSVDKLDKDTKETLETFPSQKAACEATGIASGQMSACCSGYECKTSVEVKTVGGFRWVFEEEYENERRSKGI